MKLLRYFNFALLIAFSAGQAVAQSRGSSPRDALKNLYLGSCQNPESAFSSPPSQAQMERLLRWCACMNAAIDNIPDDKLHQVSGDSFNEATGRKGFSKEGDYSLGKLAAACNGR